MVRRSPRRRRQRQRGARPRRYLISAFCTSSYHPPLDASGLPCDISGWDFYDNQDDPATVDSAYGHANGQMDTIHSMCPGCTILPVKAGDEALDPTDNLAKAWQFAADEGARVMSCRSPGRPGLLALRPPGARRARGQGHRGGGGLQRLRLHRPPGRDDVALRGAGQRGGGLGRRHRVGALG